MQLPVTHLLIPFASHLCTPGFSSEDVGRLENFDLPNLQKLLSRMKATSHSEGDEQSLTPPHERVLATLCGVDAADGFTPWAALAASQEGIDFADKAWAVLTPCYWRVGVQQVLLDNPRNLQMTDDESSTFLQAMTQFFAEDGITVHAQSPETASSPRRWLAEGDMFRGIATASLDRAIGQMLDPWMPDIRVARGIRRLQSEMQMLLYTHPLNDERMARGLPPVNSFWVSGTGDLSSSGGTGFPAGMHIAQGPRLAALNGDLEGWKNAWMDIDKNECAQMLESLDTTQPSDFRLTLCGDRHAITYTGQPKSWLQKLNLQKLEKSSSARRRVRGVLESL